MQRHCLAPLFLICSLYTAAGTAQTFNEDTEPTRSIADTWPSSAGTVLPVSSNIADGGPDPAAGPLPSDATVVVATINFETISQTFVPSTIPQYATVSETTTITSTNSFNDPITLVVGSGGVAWVPFSLLDDAPQVPHPTIPPKIDGQPGNDFQGPGPSTTGAGSSTGHHTDQQPSGLSSFSTQDPEPTASGDGDGGTMPNVSSGSWLSETTDPGRSDFSADGPSATEPASWPSATGDSTGTPSQNGPSDFGPSTSGLSASGDFTDGPSDTGAPDTWSSTTGPTASESSASGETGRPSVSEDLTSRSQGSDPQSTDWELPESTTNAPRPSSSQFSGPGPSETTNNVLSTNGPGPSSSQPPGPSTGEPNPTQPPNTESSPGVTQGPDETNAPQTTRAPDIFSTSAPITIITQNGTVATFSKETYSEFANLESTTTITTSATVTDNDGTTHETSFP
ncbi:MAG: hypothetical protein Q9172_004039, partial [Xanthocarpia lactea]